jgi:hypothetical protein
MDAAKKQVAKEEMKIKLKADAQKAAAEHVENIEKVRQAKILKEAEEEARKELADEASQMKGSRAQVGNLDLGD